MAGQVSQPSEPMSQEERDSKWAWLDAMKMSLIAGESLPKHHQRLLVDRLEQAWLEQENSPCG